MLGRSDGSNIAGKPPMALANAEALIRGHGAAAYSEARQCGRGVILPDETTHAGRMPEHWTVRGADCGEAERQEGRRRHGGQDAQARPRARRKKIRADGGDRLEGGEREGDADHAATP
jgi:hypothetical protein